MEMQPAGDQGNTDREREAEGQHLRRRVTVDVPPAVRRTPESTYPHCQERTAPA